MSFNSSISPGAVRRPTAGFAAFTLIELLLSVVVILLLFAAMILSLGDVHSGARLMEGADRFETLLRLTRAHASITGQKVRIDFVEGQANVASSPLLNVLVARETKPFEEPGVFQLLTGPEWKLSEVNDLIGVEQALPLDAPTGEPGTGPVVELLEEEPPALPWIVFHPDGSSDSARMILASREEDNLNRVEVRLEGMTGEISRRTIVSATDHAPEQAGVDEAGWEERGGASEPNGVRR